MQAASSDKSIKEMWKKENFFFLRTDKNHMSSMTKNENVKLFWVRADTI